MAEPAESIYNWIVPDPVRPEKPPMYHSKFPPTQPPTGSTLRIGSKNTTGHAMMGAELKGTVRPDAFLKSHSKDVVLPPPKALHREHGQSISSMMKGSKPPARQPRDFVTENAIAAIIASPRKPAPPPAPVNPNFAKRPAYLDRIAAQLAAERDYVLRLADAQQRDAEVAGGMREMGAEERAELVQQLKAKWTEVSNRYSVFAHKKISTSNSSVGEIRLKENCERLMTQLENDIKKLSIPGPIFVKDD